MIQKNVVYQVFHVTNLAYQEDYNDDLERCVNEEGKKTDLKEIMKLTKCKRGQYNPEECGESSEYGPTCYAPCYDEENCYDMNSDIPKSR